MLSEKVMAHLEAALHTLKREILNTVKHRQDVDEVPCEWGMRHFQNQVKTYWKLHGILDPCKESREENLAAICDEVMPDPEPMPHRD